MGDFKTPLYDSKKIGWSQVHMDIKIDLIEFINNMALSDVELSEASFTWTNRRDGKDLI